MGFFDQLIDSIGGGKGDGAPTIIAVIPAAASKVVSMPPAIVSALQAAGVSPAALASGALTPAVAQKILTAVPGGLNPHALASIQSAGAHPDAIRTLADGVPDHKAMPVGMPDPSRFRRPKMPSGSDPIVGPAYPYLSKWTTAERQALYEAQIEVGLDPAKGALPGFIQEESKGIPSALNSLPAAGLIQLTTRANLPGYTTKDAVRSVAKMSVTDQIHKIIVPLLKRFGGKFGDQTVGSMMVGLGSGLGFGVSRDQKFGDSKGSDWMRAVYEKNHQAYDVAKKGYITVGDLMAKGDDIAHIPMGRFITVSGKIIDGADVANLPQPPGAGSKPKTMADIAKRQAAHVNADPPASAPSRVAPVRRGPGGAALPQPPRKGSPQSDAEPDQQPEISGEDVSDEQQESIQDRMNAEADAERARADADNQRAGGAATRDAAIDGGKRVATSIAKAQKAFGVEPGSGPPSPSDSQDTVQDRLNAEADAERSAANEEAKAALAQEAIEKAKIQLDQPSPELGPLHNALGPQSPGPRRA